MNQGDRKGFTEIMMVAAVAHDVEMTPQRIAIYFDDLLDLDIRAIQYAVREHRKSSPFFPKVSEIRELARQWKPPRQYAVQGAERKMLETPEISEARREENKRRFREILDSLDGLDANYGTSFGKSKDMEARRRELERQAEEIKRGAA